MSVELIDRLKDNIGPEYILQMYDPASGMRAVIVIDTAAFGPAAGGIRMLPDITTEEIFHLARAMTYKFAYLDMPVGGAKSGIFANPSSPDKDKILAAYAKSFQPFLKQLIYIPGADMGTSDEEIGKIYKYAGMTELAPSGMTLKEKEGMPLEDHLTGYGVVVAAKAASEFIDLPMDGATVAIEGFGKVGGGVARYMARSGAKVVAISSIEGAIHNPDGIDVEKMLEMRKKLGDKVVLEYKDAKQIKKEELFTLPVDILVPGARPYVIHKKNADKIKAKLISAGANIPVTEEANKILLKKGVVVLPDFISNSGGVIAATLDRMEASEEQAFKLVEDRITSSTNKVLSEALDKKKVPTETAKEMAMVKIKEAIEKREQLKREDLERIVREKFET
ncbi:MAG: Glu/Leu/Phe/Val dehydrogenase [Candidatus Lokiarchaeia archaeon]